MQIKRKRWRSIGYELVHAGNSSDGFFELCNEFGDAVAHVSIRPAASLVVVNTRIRGAWGAEKRIRIPSGIPNTAVRLCLGRQNGTLVIGGHAVHNFAGIAKPDSGFRIVSNNLQYGLLDDEISFHRNDAIQIRIFGQPITLIPEEGASAVEEAKFFEGYCSIIRQLKNFISTGVFARGSVVEDHMAPYYLPSLLLGKLWKSSQPILVCGNRLQAKHATALLEANSIESGKTLLKSAIAKLRLQQPVSGETPERVVFSEGEMQVGVTPSCEAIATTHMFHVGSPLPTDESKTIFTDGNLFCQPDGDEKWASTRHRYGAHQRRQTSLDVVVAMYNTENYIEECIDSLLCDRDDVNVIVIDDGSTDRGPERVRKTFANVKQVSLHTKANGGCASARNFGRLVSKSSHIAFIDADDFVDKGFFARIFDLAVYSGFEVVQGGFDFYDSSLPTPYYDSYEKELFASKHELSFHGRKIVELSFHDLVHGQPSIWRRVYRRDFLDAKNIYFPENVRAYDDYIFHLLSVYYGREILMDRAVNYHYRQHSNQDIKKGDERHFYELYMFRLLLKRALLEGWNSFEVFARSIINCVRWSLDILKDELIAPFLTVGAQLCASVRLVFGENAMSDALLLEVKHADFFPLYQKHMQKMKQYGTGYIWGFVDGSLEHPDLLRARRA